mmetsp:Transcript_5925/g.8027  ORF Transcript_5925/g.8027 Transcript_5925/m.8027 type:complete len:114 (+) Transcript_5925:1882-2223(+)
MVFDMSKPTAAGPSKGTKKVSPAARSRFTPAARAKGGDTDAGFEVLVSDRDHEHIQSHHINQSRADFTSYRAMIDKVLGSDNELRAKGRGGELVELDTEVDPSKGDTGMTAAA